MSQQGATEGGAEEEGESVMNVERRDTSPGIVLTKSHKGGVVEVEVEGESVMNVERRGHFARDCPNKEQSDIVCYE